MPIRLFREIVRALQPSKVQNERKALGLCLSCGSKPENEGHLACVACVAKVISFH